MVFKLQRKKQSKDKTSEAKTNYTFTESMATFAFRHFGGVSQRLLRFMPDAQSLFIKSGLNYTPEVFISLVILSSLITLPISGLILFLVIANHRLIVLFPLILLPLIVFGFGLLYPRTAASSRASALDNELPFVVGYVAVLASGGISPIMTLKRLANVKLYPKAAIEAKRILMDIDVFALDPISALERAARYNPNKVFADFFGGYTSVLKTGGDVIDYMQNKIRDVFAYRALKVRSAADTIGTFAESYISIAVILGIGLFVLFAVQTILGSAAGGSGAGGIQKILLLTTVFNPIVAATFIFITHSTQPKEPFNYYKPYIYFGAGLVAIPIILLLPPLIHLSVPFVYRLAAALAVSVIPGAVVNIMDSRAKRSVERLLPSFIRDIAEVRKTGLAPEKSIEELSTRNYGGLTSIVRTMASQISWGVPLRQVISNIIAQTRSWITQTTMFLLSEVIDVGGGTPEMLGNLADFVERIFQIEQDKRNQLRPYVFIPYFGAIMIVVTTVLMVYFLTSPIVSGGGFNPFASSLSNISSVTNTMLAGAVFTSWIMGFVSGKMGEGSVAAGLKHAALLAAISGLVIYVATIFFHISGL
jgi:flagellar protein FlaJ